MAAKNCSVSTTALQYINVSRYGFDSTELDLSSIINAYISDCIDLPCSEVTEPCDTESINICEFIIEGFDVTGNEQNEIFITPSNLFRPTNPVTYTWSYDALLFDLLPNTDIHSPTLSLRRIGLPIQQFIISKVTLSCVDSRNCPATKSCYFKDMGGDLSMDCSTSNYVCAPETDFSVDTTTSSSITVSWTDHNYAYTIEVKNNVTQVVTRYAPLSAPAGTTTTYGITGLTPNTSYTIKLITNCPNGGTSIQTLNQTTPVLECPNVGFSFTDVTSTSFTVTFTFAENVSISIDGGTTFQNYTAVQNVVFTGLTPSTLYTVIVKTLCNNGGISIGLTHTTTTLPAVCTPITSVDFSDVFDTPSGKYLVTLDWPIPAGATGSYSVTVTRTLNGTTSTFTVTTTRPYTFSVDPATSFNGTVRNICSGGSQSSTTAFSGMVPSAPAPGVAPAPTVHNMDASIVLGSRQTTYIWMTVDATVTSVLIEQGDLLGNYIYSTTLIPGNNASGSNCMPTPSGFGAHDVTCCNLSGTQDTDYRNKFRVTLTNPAGTSVYEYYQWGIETSVLNSAYKDYLPAGIEVGREYITIASIGAGAIQMTVNINGQPVTLNGICDSWQTRIDGILHFYTNAVETLTGLTPGVYMLGEGEISENGCSTPVMRQLCPVVFTI